MRLSNILMLTSLLDGCDDADKQADKPTLKEWAESVGINECHKQISDTFGQGISYDVTTKLCGNPEKDVAEKVLDKDGDGSSTPNDCDDHNSLIHPYANDGYEEKVSDGIDNDCDGIVDRGVLGVTPKGLPELVFSQLTYSNPDVYVERKKDWSEFVTKTISDVNWYSGKEVHFSFDADIATLSIFHGDGLNPRNEKFLNVTLPAIYKSPALKQAIYEWTLPEIIEHFSVLTTEEQQEYIDLLSAMKSYTKKYDHNSETTYYKKLESAKATDYFLEYPPGNDWKIAKDAWQKNDYNAVPNSFPYRRAEAWVYRRIESGELKPAEIISWIDKISEALQAESK